MANPSNPERSEVHSDHLQKEILGKANNMGSWGNVNPTVMGGEFRQSKTGLLPSFATAIALYRGDVNPELVYGEIAKYFDDFGIRSTTSRNRDLPETALRTAIAINESNGEIASAKDLVIVKSPEPGNRKSLLADADQFFGERHFLPIIAPFPRVIFHDMSFSKYNARLPIYGVISGAQFLYTPTRTMTEYTIGIPQDREIGAVTTLPEHVLQGCLDAPTVQDRPNIAFMIQPRE